MNISVIFEISEKYRNNKATSILLCYTSDDGTDAFSTNVYNALLDDPGMGTKCVDDYNPSQYKGPPVQCPSITSDWEGKHFLIY